MTPVHPHPDRARPSHWVLPKTINEICRGRRGISPDMAMKLFQTLGGRPQSWLNLQMNWELSQLDEKVFEDIPPIVAQA